MNTFSLSPPILHSILCSPLSSHPSPCYCPRYTPPSTPRYPPSRHPFHTPPFPSPLPPGRASSPFRRSRRAVSSLPDLVSPHMVRAISPHGAPSSPFTPTLRYLSPYLNGIEENGLYRKSKPACHVLCPAYLRMASTGPLFYPRADKPYTPSFS
jgi:hypothetical protein